MRLPEFPSEEYSLINRLEGFFNFTPGSRFLIGAGDDAAVRRCKRDEQLIFTADTLVEDVHFSLTYMTLQEIGFKAMVASISDCAAMGAAVDSALLQVVFPDNQNRKHIENNLTELYKGIQKACVRWDFPVVGGDISKGPCWVIAVSLTGSIPEKGRVLTRIGAQIGDDLWVSGVPGMSAAGLDILKKWGRADFPQEYLKLVESHITPRACVETGLKLAQDRNVHAVIDLSDGIAKECYTLCFENDAGITLSPEESCRLSSYEELSRILNKPWYEWFLYGGEDYELLFTATDTFNPSVYEKNTLYKIGTLTDNYNNVVYIDAAGDSIPVEKRAWDHLSGKW